MEINIVHDIQSVYRKLVDSMSRPGFISDLAPEAAKLDNTSDFSKSFMLLAFTLLDPEVSFRVCSQASSDMTEKISQLTYAKQVETEEADYVFVEKSAQEGTVNEAIQKAKAGTLKDPHLSATIIVEVDELSNASQFVLKGPGIQTSKMVAVSGNEGWVKARQEKNREYPLGIDLIFIDQHQQLLALPRTTQIIENRVMV